MLHGQTASREQTPLFDFLYDGHRKQSMKDKALNHKE